MVSKAQAMAMASGDAWLGNSANILAFGPGHRQSHFGCGARARPVENGRRVLFIRTTDLVQSL